MIGTDKSIRGDSVLILSRGIKNTIDKGEKTKNLDRSKRNKREKGKKKQLDQRLNLYKLAKYTREKLPKLAN